MDISCIVLAGGGGLRLGRNKLSETFGNKSLLDRVLSRLGFISGDILVVGGEPVSPEPGGYPRFKAVSDIYPGKGPLGGIYTGLRLSSTFYNLVVASDMPFLSRGLLGYMVDISPGFELVVPRLGDLIEPLHAVYSRACLEPMERLLNEGRLSVREVFSRVRTRYVETEEIDRFDPHHRSFFNINTKADLERALGLLGEDA